MKYTKIELSEFLGTLYKIKLAHSWREERACITRIVKMKTKKVSKGLVNTMRLHTSAVINSTTTIQKIFNEKKTQ